MTFRRMVSIWAAIPVLAAGHGTAGAAESKKAFPTPRTDQVARTPSTSTGAGGKDVGIGGLLPGGRSKEPINIAAERLVFLNKENKLIYTGNVVAVQGASSLKASKLDIDIQRIGSGAVPPPADAAPSEGNSSVRHMEADGPVTITSKDQVGTGDHATYDKGENKVYLKGHVTLTQGCDVVQGDTLIYDMPSGRADVVGNVKSVFAPRGGGGDRGPQRRC